MNRCAWSQLPPDLQEIFANVLNTAAMAERAEVVKQNNDLKADLGSMGLIFNDVDPEPFHATLSKAEFYNNWKTKFGPETWIFLEESSGPLG